MESTTLLEASSNPDIIEIEHKDPYLTELAEEYMYKGDYTIEFDATTYVSTLDPEVIDSLASSNALNLITLAGEDQVALSSLTEAMIRARDPTHMVVHALLYAFATRYNIPGLKNLAMSKFETSAREHWRTPVFPIAIREVWTTMAEDEVGLKDIVVDILASRPELWKDKDVDLWLRELRGLSYAVLKKVEGKLVPSVEPVQ